MKEVTEWDNNPRKMYVWNHDFDDVHKAFVIWIKKSSNTAFKVITVTEDGNIPTYMHCAEIEPRYMTNKELARWLREKTNRECLVSGRVYDRYAYLESSEDDEVMDGIYIREGDSPWYVPYVEE